MKDLRCTYCGGSLFIQTEYVGPAYLSENQPQYIECNGTSAPRDYGCGAEWELNGKLRTAGPCDCGDPRCDGAGNVREATK